MSSLPETQGGATGKPRVGWWSRLKAWVVWALVRWLLASLRLVCLYRERREAAEREGRPILYAFWHGRQLALFAANPEPRLAVMTSLSADGELQSRVCRRFGLSVVRGSSSRGALRGLLALGRSLRDGQAVGLAVDGPRGPVFEAKPGIAILAARGGCPIVPITAGFRRRWELRRAWDHFQIPWPFTRCLVAFGEPLWLPANADSAEVQRATAELTDRLRRLTSEVDAAVRLEPRTGRE